MQVKIEDLKREAEVVLERLEELASSAEAAGRRAASQAEKRGGVVADRATVAGTAAAETLAAAGREAGDFLGRAREVLASGAVDAGGGAASGLTTAGRSVASGAAGAGGALATGAAGAGAALASGAGATAAGARLAARMAGRQAKRTYRLRRVVRPVALIVGWILVYRRWGRGWVRSWGAAGPEEQALLPGDGVVNRPKRTSTRGITIEAPPLAVWPWLAQLGQGRGGLYSYDWLENLLGCGIHSADRVLAEHQEIAPGDRVRLVRPGYPVDLCFEVAEVIPEEALVLRSPGEQVDASSSSLPWASWAFVLHPLTEGRTRLLVRWRSDFADSPSSRFWNDWGIELPHFIMERKMMMGIKERAESGRV